ncbi:VanW family protein [Ruminiclostridium cellulolyticum]|uniref:VanW family protein n=1 Tax=Ruminiclostridium cellulolyticum (strain ATCC 35319 / DSM 5812 / JCM 6584 / H10) TaxID=394503 RepID=B8I5Y9_RUMCH|nr:VanW domain-containing protein [Ruminiclostridium cellulolyticum]ACL74806.1 VanW family protein [Ruminiclostridium cellulolyticum H10]
MLYKRYFKPAIIFMFVFTYTILPFATGESLSANDVNKDHLQTSIKQCENNGNGQEEGLKNPSKSGTTFYVPWEGSENFLSCQSKNGTPIMMVAYQTVLRDPLPGEEENVHLAARLLAGTVVKPGEVFSQNNKIGPYVIARGFKKGPTYIGTKLTTTIGGGVCKMASTLYNVAILSNLPVVERHAHSMPVPYVPYGQDATVSYGNKDLKFKNDTSSPIMIWAQGVDNILYVAFYSSTKPPEVEWHHEMLKLIKADKVYKMSSTLPKGREKLLMEGMDGAIVKSWVTVKNPDGTVIKRDLRKSYYNPMPHVYEKGK